MRTTLFAVGLATLLGCGERRKPPDRDDWPDVGVEAQPMSVKSTPMPQVFATPLWEEYDRDGAKAEAKYGRRAVAVTGTVAVVTAGQDDSSIGFEVTRPGPRQEKSAGKGVVRPGVVCFLSDRAAAARVKIGDQLTVIGVKPRRVDDPARPGGYYVRIDQCEVPSAPRGR